MDGKARQSTEFLSSNAQDFIEEAFKNRVAANEAKFLSSNAQDFIEDGGKAVPVTSGGIPEQ